MSKKIQVKKNSHYLKINKLVRVQSIVPEEVKEYFDLATMRNKTNMSEAIRKFILKYNSKYINRYENKSN
jgi:hypothetical protein